MGRIRGIGMGVIFALLIGVGFHSFETLIDRSIVREAARASENWARYAEYRLPQIDAIAAGSPLTETERTLIEELTRFGNVFRFKIFDTAGRLRLLSDNLNGVGAETREGNGKALNALALGAPVTEIADGTRKPDRPDVYSETYLPVMRDGKAVAIVEVYLDQTETAAAARADFTMIGLLLSALAALGLLVPTLLYRNRIEGLIRETDRLRTERNAYRAEFERRGETIAIREDSDYAPKQMLNYI